MTNLTIRAATPDDRHVLAGLNAEVQRLHATSRPEDFKPANVDDLALWFAELSKNRSATVWIAERNGVPIGYVVVVARDMPENTFCKARMWWELDQVCVAADHRRHGVCRALVQKVLTEARKQGILHVELQTWAFNQEAQDAFCRLGFAPKRVRYELRVDSNDPSDAAS